MSLKFSLENKPLASIVAMAFASWATSCANAQADCDANCGGMLTFDPAKDMVASVSSIDLYALAVPSLGGCPITSGGSVAGSMGMIMATPLLPCSGSVSLMDQTMPLVNTSTLTDIDTFGNVAKTVTSNANSRIEIDGFANPNSLEAHFSGTITLGTSIGLLCPSIFTRFASAAAVGFSAGNITIPFTVCEAGFYTVDALLQDPGGSPTGKCDGTGFGASVSSFEGTWAIQGAGTGDHTLVATGTTTDREISIGQIAPGNYVLTARLFAVADIPCWTANCNGTPAPIPPNGTLSDNCQANGLFDVVVTFSTTDPATEPTSTCCYDLDGDGMVGTNDFFTLLQNWGPCPGGIGAPICLWDCTGAAGLPDGTVGTDDFFELLQSWGPCP